MEAKGSNLTFVLITHQRENLFFDVVHEGCVNEAEKLTKQLGGNASVECLYLVPPNPDVYEQLALLRGLIANNSTNIHGIMLIPIHPADLLVEVVNEAAEKGIPTVVLNDDVPNSKRLARIGTDNYALGRTLGKILLQLKPNGGRYSTIYSQGETLDLRAQGLQEYLADTPWTFVSAKDCQESIAIAMDLMEAFPSTEPTLNAIIPLGGWPMYDPERWTAFANTHIENITLVSADALPVQIHLLNSGHVHGLAGQAAYQIGSRALETLYYHRLHPDEPLPVNIFVTSVLEYLRVPLVLPPLTVDMNHIGNLKYIGLTMFVLVALTAIACASWVWVFRKIRVVKVSQPMFLLMVILGAFLMGSTLLPLSFVDAALSEEGMNEMKGTTICMSVPWLAFLGFTVTFSALFSKTWRVNRLFSNNSAYYSRMRRVAENDVLVPFVVLLLANVAVLVLWTVLDPMMYERQAHPGSDGWNRVISTYGSCQSQNSPSPFLIPLFVLNMGVLLVANWQAYRARFIESELSEATYIGFVMAILLQAALTGVPLLFVISDNPQAYYLVLVSMIFIVNMSILLLIFVPKVKITERFRRQSDGAQTRFIEDSVRLSQQRAAESRRPAAAGAGGSSSFRSSNTSSDQFRMTLSGNNGICAVCRQSRPLVGVIGAEFTRPPPHQQELEDITSSNRTGSNSGRPASSSNKNVDSADWYEAELPSSGSSRQHMNIAENVAADSSDSRQQRTSVPDDEKSEELPAMSAGTVALGESSDSIIKGSE